MKKFAKLWVKKNLQNFGSKKICKTLGQKKFAKLWVKKNLQNFGSKKVCKTLGQKKFAKLWVNIVAKGNILGWLLYFCNNHWWTRYVWYKCQLRQWYDEKLALSGVHKIWGVFALFSATAHRREMGVPPLDRASKVTYGAYHLEPIKCR